MINNIEQLFNELGAKLEDNINEFNRKINKEKAKCAIKIFGIFFAIIAPAVIGIILNFMTVLIYTPIVCYIGTALLAPFGIKLLLDVLNRHTDIMELLMILLINSTAQTLKAFAEENNIDLEIKNDTNITI